MGPPPLKVQIVEKAGKLALNIDPNELDPTVLARQIAQRDQRIRDQQERSGALTTIRGALDKLNVGTGPKTSATTISEVGGTYEGHQLTLEQVQLSSMKLNITWDGQQLQRTTTTTYDDRLRAGPYDLGPIDREVTESVKVNISAEMLQGALAPLQPYLPSGPEGFVPRPLPPSGGYDYRTRSLKPDWSSITPKELVREGEDSSDDDTESPPPQSKE